MDLDSLDYKIQKIIKELSKILNNLKKAPFRNYKRATLLQKLSNATTLYKDLELILVSSEKYIPDNLLNFYIKGSRLEYNEIKELIKLKLETKNYISIVTSVLVIVYCIKLKKACRKIVSMPTVDIKLGTSLVNTYDGSPAQLNAFVDAVALYSDTVDAEFQAATADQKAAAKATVVRFVKTRLIGSARQAIGELNDLQQIIAAIKLRCGAKISADGVLAKLKAARQTSSTENFCETVEKLADDLRSAYINENIPADTAEKMATKRGVEALATGIKNPESKLIMKAGTFGKISDAVQKLQENESREPSTSRPQIFHVRGHHIGYRGRGRGFSGRGNRPRGRNSFHNGRYNGNSIFSNNFRTSSNGNWRGGNSYQHQPRYQGPPGRHIFYNSQGNSQVPQLQPQIGGTANNQQTHQQIPPQQLAQILHRQ